jgi:predicted O-linked N-acetylglucosamine transferase (SPINDLY family)
MYRKMGLPECIAQDGQDYIDQAVRLASDAGHRARISSEIMRRNSALFEDIQVVREFERFFEETASTA